MSQGRRRRLFDALKAKVSKGRRDERGAVAIIFALAVVVLAPMILGLFDIYTASQQRARLQDALDAAALYAARTDLQTDAEIDAAGDVSLAANLKLIRGASLVSSTFSLADGKSKVVASATVRPVALAPAFWAHPDITVTTDVVRASKNLEVSLVLDVTNSMNAGTRIADLRTAAADLVDLIVKDIQAPYYSKIAVVPWSAGVNLGAYADSVRGPATAAKGITAASWSTGTAKTITAATKASPVVITASSHGFNNGDKVFITGVAGMTQLNNKMYTVAGKTTNTFQLRKADDSGNIDGTGYSTFSSAAPNNARVTKCALTSCAVTVTSNGHGFTNGAYIVLTDLAGLTDTATSTTSGSTRSINNYVYTVAGATTNTFVLTETVGGIGAYTSGGNAWCTNYGCEYYRFASAGSGNPIKVFKNSTCVSERTTAQVYTDAAPSNTYVGFNYPAQTAVAPYSVNTNNPCLTPEIIPLSTDKVSVKAAIAALTADGSTGGQVGVAWGWYMVSPNFGYLWPSASRPAAYTAPETLKVVVLMTDGALNTAYCNGVIAKDSTSGSGSASDHSNCNATNGSTFNQSKTLCTNMKTAGVIVYTVGFQITGDTTAEDLMDWCATDEDHEYLPTTGADLQDAFKAIGADINGLRLAR